MPPQKGKAATKGQKQIVEDNKSTIKFYTLMALGSMALNLSTCLLLMTDWLTISYAISQSLCAVVYLSSVSVLRYMARPVYSSSNALVDGGTDLNMENGFAENLKDLIILTAGVQTLGLVSSYFWALWLLAPLRAFYMLWANILAPWFFQAPPEQEVDEKKQKKMERKMRRHQQ